MKTKFFPLLAILFATQIQPAMACAVCSGARDSQSTHNMAIAIWVLLGAVMSVLGGVGAFGFHLWRHANMPLEPHQELAEENFEQYE
jgi:nitrate reductase NapE component